MEITRHWRLKAQRYRLEGSTCPACGEKLFPPRPVCPRCTVELTQIARRELTLVQILNRTFDTVSSKG